MAKRAGFAEETIFRGLLTGMLVVLVVLVPGRLRIGRIDLPLAAYIVALIFGSRIGRASCISRSI